MKKFLTIALSLMLVLALVACGGSPSSTPAASTPAASTPAGSTTDSSGDANAAGGLHIGLSMNALDEYQTNWLEYFQAYVEGLGHTLTVVNAESKVDKQLADVESLIQMKPDVICIKSVDQDGAVPCVDACNAAGIPNVDLDMGINTDETVTVMSSQYNYGALTGEFANDWLEKNPDETIRMGYIIGVETPNVMGRYQGILDVLDEAGNSDRYEVVATKVCNWSATEAMAVVEDWMQAYPDMNWICAMSDEMAIAAVQVVEAAGKGADVVITGVDGSGPAMEEIAAGRLDGTAFIPRQLQAEAAADIIIRVGSGEFEALKGETFDLSTGNVRFITQDNLEDIKAEFNL